MPRPPGPRKWTPAEKRRMKYADYMRKVGTPLFITADERKALVEHLGKLREAGMSYTGIAASAPGLHDQCTVAKLFRKPSSNIHRDVYNDLMQARFVPPKVVRAGSRFSPVGVHRRLRALVVAGFGYHLLGAELGVSAPAVSQLIEADRMVTAVTVERIARLYDKLAFADPFDYGGTRQGVSRSKGLARRKGWVPAHCWDPDTIDDPAAIPEWTGACGTQEGHRIHKREGIPICPPCHAASRDTGTPPVVRPGQFSGARMRKIREGRTMSRRELCERVGMDESSIIYWESGRSVPRKRNLDRVLSVLGATFEDVCQESEEE